MSHSVRLAWLLPGLLLFAPFTVRAADEPPKADSHVAVAKLVSESGSLLSRDALLKPWKVLKKGDELLTGELLVGGFDLALESLDGTVDLRVNGDQADKEPFPVLETALVLHKSKDFDFDFTLDRGRITVTNDKKSGPAKVRIRIRGTAGEMTLKNPGDSFSLEIYGRWPTGVPFKKDAKPDEGPPLALVFLVLKGEVEVKTPKRQATLKAPPGPAMFITDSIEADTNDPVNLDKLPEWALEGKPSEDVQKRKAALARYRKLLLNKSSVGEALDDLVKSEEKYDRRLAVLMMGGLDDLPRLADTLMNARQQDVWDNGVLALRHWIGRAPGQDMLLYNGLIVIGRFKPAQAEVILSLLHSFGEDDLNKPETYEVLIDYLESERLSIRGLANWHLSRLVPQGKKFGYDPFAEKDKREAAIKDWRKLIPVGKLPPKQKLDDK